MKFGRQALYKEVSKRDTPRITDEILQRGGLAWNRIEATLYIKKNQREIRQSLVFTYIF